MKPKRSVYLLAIGFALLLLAASFLLLKRSPDLGAIKLTKGDSLALVRSKLKGFDVKQQHAAQGFELIAEPFGLGYTLFGKPAYLLRFSKQGALERCFVRKWSWKDDIWSETALKSD